MSARDFTRVDLARIARLGATPETRRAAAEALHALDALNVRIALDTGCATHERPDGADAVVATLGPAPVAAPS
jgi:hypothetical protein